MSPVVGKCSPIQLNHSIFLGWEKKKSPIVLESYVNRVMDIETAVTDYDTSHNEMTSKM